MRAYEDLYGFIDAIGREQSKDTILGMLDQDLARLALHFRPSQPDSFYSARNGLTGLVRQLMINDLLLVMDDPTKGDVDRGSLQQAIDCYIDNYTTYGVELSVHGIDVSIALELEKRGDYSELPIKEVQTMDTIVGVPKVLRSDAPKVATIHGEVKDGKFHFTNAISGAVIGRIIQEALGQSNPTLGIHLLLSEARKYISYDENVKKRSKSAITSGIAQWRIDQRLLTTDERETLKTIASIIQAVI